MHARSIAASLAKRSLLVATSAFLSFGCATPNAPPVVVECTPPNGSARPGPALVGQTYGMQMTPIPLDGVQFDSHGTAARVAVQQLWAARTPTDTVAVQARFVSCMDAPSQISVRTSFMRADGTPVEAPSAWKRLFLTPHALALYSESSVGRDVRHYVVEVAQ